MVEKHRLGVQSLRRKKTVRTKRRYAQRTLTSVHDSELPEFTDSRKNIMLFLWVNEGQHTFRKMAVKNDRMYADVAGLVKSLFKKVRGLLHRSQDPRSKSW